MSSRTRHHSCCKSWDRSARIKDERVGRPPGYLMASAAFRCTTACNVLPCKPPTMRHFRSACKCRNLQMQRRAMSTRALDKAVSIFSSLARMTCLTTKIHEKCLDDRGIVLVMVSSAIRQMCCQDKLVFRTASRRARGYQKSRMGSFTRWEERSHPVRLAQGV